MNAQLLPKCSVPGCRLWVWNETPSVKAGDMHMYTGPSVPLSDKCWYHHHGLPVPEGAR